MWMSKQHRLDQLKAWREKGWVTDEGAGAIRKEIETRRSLLNLSNTLAILGAVLICFAAMSFVAANWSAIPRLVRVAILLSTLWASFLGAGVFYQRGQQAFGHAASLVGCGMFGASIMLIAQMFHLDGNPPDAVLVWGLGTLLAGFAFRSAPTLVLALLLFGLWSGWETSLTDREHWWFLPFWALTAFGFIWQRWNKGYELSSYALGIWVFVTGSTLPGGPYFDGIALLGLCVLAAGVGLHLLKPDLPKLSAFVAYFGAALFFIAAIIFQMSEKLEFVPLTFSAVFVLGVMLAVIVWANAQNDRKLLWLAYAAFAAEVLFVYFKTIGSLFGSGVFFLTVGLVVMALAYVATKLHKKQERNEQLEGAV